MSLGSRPKNNISKRKTTAIPGSVYDIKPDRIKTPSTFITIRIWRIRYYNNTANIKHTTTFQHFVNCAARRTINIPQSDPHMVSCPTLVITRRIDTYLLCVDEVIINDFTS